MLQSLTITRRKGRPVLRVRLSDGRTAETSYESKHQAAAVIHNRFAAEGLGLYDQIMRRLEGR